MSGFRLIELARIDSTNSEALRRAEAGAADGTLIWAHEQSAGRGRQGRAWQTLAGNLACSYLLRPDLPPARLAELSLLAGLALADAVERELPASSDLALKWPNDLLLAGAKLGGILLETAGQGAAGQGAVVLGFGVNVASAPDPADITYPATCLAAHAPGVTARQLLDGLSDTLGAWLQRWRAEGFAAVRERWLARGPKTGALIRVRSGSEILAGRYRGLSPEGGLLLDTPDGLQRLLAGDVLAAAA